MIYDYPNAALTKFYGVTTVSISFVIPFVILAWCYIAIARVINTKIRPSRSQLNIHSIKLRKRYTALFYFTVIRFYENVLFEYTQ
mgnify:CR=1 FL=1